MTQNEQIQELIKKYETMLAKAQSYSRRYPHLGGTEVETTLETVIEDLQNLIK